jgi:hypothetical protein
MTAIRGILFFGVQRLWVRRELLGRSWTIKNEEGRVELALPPLIRQGEMFLAAAGLPDDPVGQPTMGTADDPLQMLSVNAIRATVDLNVDLSEWEPGPLSLYARDVAREAVIKLTAWARILHDQPWLGLSSDFPTQIGRQGILNAETGEPIPGTVRELLGVRLLSEDAALDDGDMESIIDRTGRGDAIPIAETLLRDAEYLAWANPSERLRACCVARRHRVRGQDQEHTQEAGSRWDERLARSRDRQSPRGHAPGGLSIPSRSSSHSRALAQR